LKVIYPANKEAIEHFRHRMANLMATLPPYCGLQGKMCKSGIICKLFRSSSLIVIMDVE